MSIYDFIVKGKKGDDVPMSEFKGKVLLIVNTATGCGHTKQYAGLEALYQKYKGRGFEILDFPCNQFGGQAPGTIEEIESFCTLKYNTTFPLFAKVKVNGKEEEPLFKYLKEMQSTPTGARIKWNFTKFLVDREGNVVQRYPSATKPEELEEDIEKLL